MGEGEAGRVFRVACCVESLGAFTRLMEHAIRDTQRTRLLSRFLARRISTSFAA